MCLDQNATHVVQKVIQTIPENRRILINFALFEDFVALAKNMYGVCVLKHFIIYNNCQNFRKILIYNVSLNLVEISMNQFGNYLTQFIVERWGMEKFLIEQLIVQIENNAIKLANNKFSFNIFEKCFTHMEPTFKWRIIKSMFYNSKSGHLLKSKHGQAVVEMAVKNMNSYMKNEIKDIVFKKINRNHHDNPDSLMTIYNLIR
jgi:hypothetical protein